MGVLSTITVVGYLLVLKGTQILTLSKSSDFVLSDAQESIVQTIVKDGFVQSQSGGKSPDRTVSYKEDIPILC